MCKPLKYRYPLAILALLGLLLSAVPLDAAHAQSSPSVAIELSPSDPVEPGTEIAVTISYAGLDVDSDGSTIDYIFRADVKNADDTDADTCEDEAGGYGLGVDRNMRRVDSNPEVRRGKVSADCPAGSYTIEAVIASAANVELASASLSFTIGEPPADEPDETDEECSYDPTPTAIEVTAVPIVVDSTADDYFVLHVRHDLDSETVDVPVLVKRGEAGTTTLAENVKALPKERYRVEKYLIADPADVDGDCIDDITELDDFGPKNPVNPAPAIDASRGVVAVPDEATWRALIPHRLHSIKFSVLGTDTDRPYIYFQNARTYDSHHDFLTAIGIDPYGPGVATGALSYVSNLEAPDGSQGTYVFELIYARPFRIADLSLTMLAAGVPLLDEGKVIYFIRNKHLPAYQHETALYEDSRINLRFERDLFSEREFRSLNEAVGYGFLRVMDLDERPSPRDVAVYDALPNELPRVAGIITTVSQTPLSHVNLRAVQDGVPNAYIRDARTNYVNGLVGRYVRYEVGRGTYSIRAATRAEVDAHFASSRPSAEQTPQRDLSVTEIKPLSQVGFNDWRAFGVKAANVAVLRTFGFPSGTIPDGFAIPFYFYDEFMKHNGFYEDIEELLADADFQTDLEEQEKKLKKMRKAIKKGETPQWIIDALAGMHATYPDGQTLRYRSSTNNEDLPGFSGAGLYDSKTQKPDETEEDGIGKSLKQVYASLWNFRAFTERDFHRIDHLSAAMGVLVHPNYSDELVNGVAVSFNPLYGSYPGYFYVNSQVGEDLVTNPEALSVPEEILLSPTGSAYHVIHTSSQKPPGQLLMSDSQVNQLRRHLKAVQERFEGLYNPGSGEEFAMEIEFKITSDNVLAIKQARPWVFESSTASSDAPVADPPSKDATLSALTLSGVDIGTFASTTTRYAASVANGVTETTVTPTVSDDGATHAVKLDGTADADGTVALAVGSNVITVAVTSEDGNTIRAYTVTVTRAEASGTDDATLSALELSGVDFGTFDSATTGYTASVANDVTETTVTATVNDHGAAYAVKLGGTEDADGTVALAVGANVITIEVTAEDGQTTRTYRVTVTRAAAPPPSNDATLSALTLSGVIFDFDPATYSYDLSVDNEVTETTITVETNHAGASYEFGLMITGGYEDGTMTLAEGSNLIYLSVTAEDGETTASYVITITRAASSSVDATLSALELSGVDIGTFDLATTEYIASVANDVTETTVTATANDGGATYVVKLGGVEDADGTVDLAVGANAITIEVTAVDGQTTRTYRVTVTRAAAPPSSNDATLSGLTLSGVSIGTFASATTEYTANVANDVTATTVTPTVSDGGATYVVKLGGVEDADGTVDLAVGANTITVEVTAEDGQTTGTYRVTVTRAAAPPSDDATLSSLTLSGVNFGTFASATTEYTASVANDVTETTVTATANDGGAAYVVKLGGVADADGTVDLAVGANVITVEVTAEDGQTTRTYRVTVTRAAAPPTTNPVPQLTARFEEAPQSHDGTNPFTFHIAFSEAISVSFVTIRDHALEVTGGSVTGAWRVDSRNDLWGIRVQPDSDADVEIALPANRACDTQGAVCTADDKVLSNRPEMTIPGPAPATTPVNSPATGAPSISGTAQVGQTLTASTSGIADANGLTNATFSYQWIAGDGTTDTDITGATSTTYTLADADEGKTVKVRVTFTDDGGNDESLTSAATAAVIASSNSLATGAPTISGKLEEGKTLTANTSGIADADGINNAEFSYRWLAAAVGIQGATSSTYTLTDDEVGMPIRVRVTFTDDAGYDETLTSTATAAVTNEDLCPGGGYDPTPTAVKVEAVPIVVDSTTADYFVLYVQPDLNSAREIPVSVTLGQNGTTTLPEQLSALSKEHYRVEKYLISDPGDVDGDCIDDVTELREPVAMNPLNPAPAIRFVDGAVAIPDRETFEALSYKGKRVLIDTHLTDLEFVKFWLIGTGTEDPSTRTASADRPGVYFMNTETHRAHYRFASVIDLKENPAWGPGPMRGEIVYHPNVVAPDGSLGVYRYEFEPNDAYSFEAVAYSYELLAASMPLLDDNLAYYPMPARALPLYNREKALYDKSRINVLFEADILPDVDFIPLNVAEGYGFLRVMSLEERPNPRDIVIYETLPNELSRVAGIITTVPQTPLSHVNLRAVQDGAPNAFIRDALDDDDIDDLIGRYVRYEVTDTGWEVRAATRAEVDAHFVSSQPAAEQTPKRDLSVTEINPLSQIGFDDWTAFGVKAANLAVLRTFGFPSGTVPDGFAVPFYFYDEFMKHNGFYDDIEEMLADTDFQTDYDEQESKLKKLRKAIKKGETPDWIITALTDMHATFATGTSLRYRSSTNNEDLPGFSGAGLYDSKTQNPEETEEDGIDKSLKQVYASLWNFRAFIERDFQRIDHLAAAMGVLVHPNYSDEKVNGVAVSFDPIRGTDGSYYVNSQLGEDLVTNPEAYSVPEEVLLQDGGTYEVLATSNQVSGGDLLMTDAQMEQLRQRLTVTHDRFRTLYDPDSGEEFAMEVEFKITSDDVLAIKQARPWVFEIASDETGASVAESLSKDATLSGLTLSGIDIGTFESVTTRYTDTVANDVATTTVTPTVSDSGATYVVKLGGVEDADWTVDLAVGSNVITVEVTSADGNTIRAYIVAVTRTENAANNNPATGAPSISGTAQVGQTLTASTSGIADADGLTNAVFSYQWIANDGTTDTDISGATAATYTLVDADEGKTVKVRVTFTDDGGNAESLTSAATGAVAATPSTDATLSNLTLSGINFGAFASATTNYTASVGNDVTETTVTPTASDDGASYVVKLSGVEDADRTVDLAVGANVITVVVTAEDGNTTKTYRITVIRAEAPPSDDATLSSLDLSGVNFGTFDPATTDYTASVANDVTETTVTATANDDGATYAVRLDGVEDADGTVALAVGSNAVSVVVTAEDGNTAKTYRVTVTRAEAPPSDDATLSSLNLSGVNFGTFNSATTDYTASVGNDVTETTVTATANDDGATYVVRLDGVEDADGTVALAVGANAVTIEVTAEDGQTTKTYTVTVTRAAPTAATVPDAPDIPSGRLTGVGSVALDWNDVPTAVSYDVMLWQVDAYVQLSADAPVNGISITFDGSGATASGLPADYEWYYFVVRAVNGAGASDWSPNNAVSAKPATPDSPTGRSTGPGTVSLDWNDVTAATSYEVSFWQGSDYITLSADAPVNGISITFNGSGAAVSGLPTDHDWYYFRVRAVNDAGASDWSDYGSVAAP